MSRKMILKLLVDTIMTVLMIIMMGYNVTGNKIHEILGITLFILFIIHCIINRNWFISLPNIIKNFTKNKLLIAWVITNILFILDMIVLAISSVMISREVFAGLSIEFNSIWRYIHNLCAYGGLIIMSIHLGFHWNMIIGGIKRAFHIQGVNLLRNILLKSLAFLMVVAGIKSSFDRSIGSKLIPDSLKLDKEVADDIHTTQRKQSINQAGQAEEPLEKNQTEVEKDKFRPGKHGNKNSENKTFTETIDEGETLNDFLGKLICTGCGKQCSLLTPQCSRGVEQAQEATIEYQALYGEENSQSTALSDLEEEQDTILVSDDDNSLIGLFMDFVPIMGLYVAGTYYTIKIVNRKKKTR